MNQDGQNSHTKKIRSRSQQHENIEKPVKSTRSISAGVQTKPKEPTQANDPTALENQKNRKDVQIVVPKVEHVKTRENTTYSIISRRIESTSQNSPQSSGPCFVATVAFGSPLADEVQALRTFRDEKLRCYAPGRAFITFYYKYGPYMADSIENKPLVKKYVRRVLRLIIKIVG